MSDVIQEYIEQINQTWQAELCQKLNQVIHEAVPDVDSRIQYKKPHYLKNGKYVAVFGTAKAWVSFTIFNATELEAPSDVFESSDNGDRITAKFREGQAVDDEQLTALVKQAADSI